MGVEEIIFWQNHWKFSFVTLPQEIPGKASLLEFPKLVLHPLEIPMPISKTRANSTWFFLDHPCIFLFWATGISTFYLEIPCPQPPPKTKSIQPICWKDKHIQPVLFKWVGPLVLFLKAYHIEDLNSKKVQSLITMGKSFANLFWSYNFRVLTQWNLLLFVNLEAIF